MIEETLLQAVADCDVRCLKECLRSPKINVDYSNQQGESALHIACDKGYVEMVNLLIAAGANIDSRSNKTDSPINIAMNNKDTTTVILLLHSGADFDVPNLNGDAPAHVAAREGMTDVIKTLCRFGCNLDVPNRQGLYPIHLAARNGHIDVIRCLCLYGCNIEQKNRDGIKAEITAVKHGFNRIGDLLYKLRMTSSRETLVNDLMPTNKTITRINVKFIGASSSGKTTLISSLKAGYFVGLFSRSKGRHQSSSLTSQCSQTSPTKTHIEMDVTSKQCSNSEYSHYSYTRGIEVHQATFNSIDVTLWDFSGMDTYYLIYDFFLGDITSIYVVVFNLKDPPCTQYYQCSFWLTFLLARIQPPEPYGKPGVGPRVLLVGTHADTSRVSRDQQGAFVCPCIQEMRKRLAEEFPHFIFLAKIILCDAYLPNSQGLRDIKNAITENKGIVFQTLPKWTGFLENVVQWLPLLRKELEMFPVLTLRLFMENIHQNINPLVGVDHVSELITQLVNMGEVVLLKTEEHELVILNISWLCSEVLGSLLSLESIARARLTGCYTEDDFQGAFSHGPADKILPLLEAFNLCTQCENDDEIEYEFPCYNLVEKLDGLWAAADERYSPPNSCYGGVRLKAPYRLLQSLFPRFQVQLRRTTNICQDPDSDLYQWFRGSKLCSGDIEGLVTLEQDGQVIDVRVRGTNCLRLACFYFMEEILSILDQVLVTMLPGVACERHVLSAEELRLHSDSPHCWRPEHIMSALLTPTGFRTLLHNPNLGQDESVLQLIGFGSENVLQVTILGSDISVSELSTICRLSLSRLIDPNDPLGKDWCLLAVKLGLSHKISTLDNEFNKTNALLDLWSVSKHATIGNLIKILIEFGRKDAAEVLMQSVSFYRITATPTNQQ